MAAIYDILHRLVILLNLGGLKNNRKFGSAVWGYDLHTATQCTSFRLMAAHVFLCRLIEGLA